VASAVERWTGLGWKDQGVALLVGFGHGGTHWVLATFYLILPFAAKDLGLSYSEVGFLVAAVHLSSAVANIGSGLAVDVTGRKVVFQIIALMIGAAAFAAFAFSPGFPVLILLVALIGGAANLWHPAAISFLADRFPEKKGYALSLHVLGASVADSLAPLTAGALVAWLAWQGTAVVGALPSLLAALLLAALLLRYDGARGKEGGAQSIGDYFRGIREMISDKAVLCLCVMSGFRTATINGLYVFLPLYLADILHFPPIWMGASMTALQLGGVLGTPIAGVASDRMSRRSIMISALIFSTATLSGAIFIRNGIAFVAAVSAVGFVLFSVRPVIQSWMIDLTPPNVGGSAISLMFGTQATLSALSPAVGGIIADHWGLNAVFFMLAGTMLTANVFVFFLPRRNKRL